MTIVPKITKSITGTDAHLSVKLGLLPTTSNKIHHSGGLDGVQSVLLLINEITEPVPVQNEYSFIIKSNDICLLVISTPNGSAKYKLN